MRTLAEESWIVAVRPREYGDVCRGCPSSAVYRLVWLFRGSFVIVPICARHLLGRMQGQAERVSILAMIAGVRQDSYYASAYRPVSLRLCAVDLKLRISAALQVRPTTRPRARFQARARKPDPEPARAW